MKKPCHTQDIFLTKKTGRDRSRSPRRYTAARYDSWGKGSVSSYRGKGKGKGKRKGKGKGRARIESRGKGKANGQGRGKAQGKGMVRQKLKTEAYQRKGQGRKGGKGKGRGKAGKGVQPSRDDLDQALDEYFGKPPGDSKVKALNAELDKYFGRASSDVGGSKAPNLLEKVAILPHGILGAQMRRNRSIVKRVDEPNSETAFVDPAGLHHIQPPGGPSGAGGAAQAIYKFLGISEAEAFPKDVIDAVKRVGDAKYHKYGDVKHAIHVVGPDLRGLCESDGSKKDPPEPPSLKEALGELTSAYGNILKQFVITPLPRLWLLPVSSGIFSGEFKDEMPSLTMAALQRGFARSLSSTQQKKLLERDIQLCIFEERELDSFQEALDSTSKLYPGDSYELEN